jgi:hypothetical protein
MRLRSLRIAGVICAMPLVLGGWAGCSFSTGPVVASAPAPAYYEPPPAYYAPPPPPAYYSYAPSPYYYYYWDGGPRYVYPRYSGGVTLYYDWRTHRPFHGRVFRHGHHH